MSDIINVALSQTQKSLYIVDLKSPDERMEIQFVPHELRMDSTANHGKIEVVGRNNPLYHYINGEDNLSFQLDLYADETEKTSVLQRVRWLQSLRYNDGYTRRKRNVLLIWGDMFRNENMVWIVTSVSVRYTDFDGAKSFRPQQAYVDLKLTLDPRVNLRESDIRV